MTMKTHKRIGILSLVFGVAVLTSTNASGAVTSDAPQEKCQVVVRLESKNTTKEQMAGELRKQLGICRVPVSEKEVQSTANNALNLVNKSKEPLKGVIYIKTKKFTFCVSWGDDKTFCKAPS